MHVTEGRRTEDVWNACFAIGLSFFHSQRKRVVQLPSLGLLHAAMFTFAMGFAMTALSVEPVIHWTFDGGAATNSGSGGAAYDATLTGTVAEGCASSAEAKATRSCPTRTEVKGLSRSGTSPPGSITTTQCSTIQ